MYILFILLKGKLAHHQQLLLPIHGQQRQMFMMVVQDREKLKPCKTMFIHNPLANLLLLVVR